MPRQDDDDSRKRKRVSNACQRCRKNKIKCSGTNPCAACNRGGRLCEFDFAEKKVLVSESVLHNLRTRVNEYERQQRDLQSQTQLAYESLTPLDYQAAADPSDTLSSFAQAGGSPSSNVELHGGGPLPNEDISDPSGVSNPLVPEQPAYISDLSGHLRYLGHSSTWSFSRQVLHMAHQSPYSNLSAQASMHAEGEAYNVDPGHSLKFSSLDTSGLPSVDISLYYLQCVKFRTHPLYHLFDETDFATNLHRYYENPVAYSQAHPLWFIHFLLIMAFGKAFTTQTPTVSGSPGSQLFKRALRLLPDVTCLISDRLESIEILCCIALYLESVDHRSAAHAYIGQAVRLAQSHGLHTNVQASIAGDDFLHRGRRVWWTVYTLDRKLTSSSGVPQSIRDEDVTASLSPAEDTDVTATGQVIHVRTCQLLGKVTSIVYSTDGKLNKTYITTAQKVLRGVASLAEELAVFSGRCSGEVSRVAASLHLAYHQCIILASRPFLYFLLKQRLEGSNPFRNYPLSPTTKGLVQVCIDSAVKTVTILSQLSEHDLVDAFLPFDLQSAFSAAFVLLMASSVHPNLLPQYSWFNTVLDVLESIVQKGNILAALRKSEVDELAQILHGLNHAHPNATSSVASDAPLSTPSLPSLGDPFFDEWNPDDGFSGAQIMDLADALVMGELDDMYAG